MSQNQLAYAIVALGNRIHAIVNGTRDISGDTDLRLCKFFGFSEGTSYGRNDTMEAKHSVAAKIVKMPHWPKKAAYES